MKKFWSLPLLALLALVTGASVPPPAQFGISTDELRIRAAVMDYVEGIYERDTARLARSLHPDVRRHVQVAREEDADGSTLDHEGLLELASAGECMPRRGPKRVQIYELRNNVAAAKLTTAWGVDLLHLAKEDGRWKIVGIVGTATREAGAA